MGLDMYLEVRRYVSRTDFSTPGNYVKSQEYSDLIANAPEGIDKYTDFGGIQVSYPAGYWRKANAIHGWFVRECQGGEDNCQSYYVPREKLVQLQNSCRAVLLVHAGANKEDVAIDHGLSPTQGFFFGSTEMDEYYDQDLKYTIEMLDHVLSIIPDELDYSFYYTSSW
jgi:hypothetical protein